MNTKQLSISLKIVLANSFVLLYKAESYHWNCQGKRFNLAHNFFKEQYDELFVAVDEIAEMIRILGEYPQISMKALLEFATIQEDTELPNSINNMFGKYLSDTNLLLESIKKLIDIAEAEKEHCVMDLAISRGRVHKKTQWMLKSLLANSDE